MIMEARVRRAAEALIEVHHESLERPTIPSDAGEGILLGGGGLVGLARTARGATGFLGGLERLRL